MRGTGYTPEEDEVLLSYTGGLDRKDYTNKAKEFSIQFKLAARHMAGRSPDALRKRYLRLIGTGHKPRNVKPKARPLQTPPQPVHLHTVTVKVPAAKTEPIRWDEPFIQPPSREQLMGRR